MSRILISEVDMWQLRGGSPFNIVTNNTSTYYYLVSEFVKEVKFYDDQF